MTDLIDSSWPPSLTAARKSPTLHRAPGITALSAILLVVSGCASAGRPEGAGVRQHLTSVNIVMGYQQSVQFAPFYVAVSKGYYRQAGLNVSFNYQIEPNALTLLASGKTDFVDSGGDEVMTAAAQGLGVKYVLTQYSRFPSALFFLRGTGIRHVSNLKGKTIGIPGKYGASYYGLLTLLGKNHVPVNSVKINAIGYNQVTAVETGKVDAAMGYATNEPVELKGQGKKVGEFDVYHWANIAGAGIATSNTMIQRHSHQVRSFVRATLQGLRFTLAHPDKAFTICKQAIPGLTDLNLQRMVLNRNLDFWRAASVPLGHMDPAVWSTTQRILRSYGQLKTSGKPTQYYTNRFVG